jgi:hypothetical protein
MLVCLGRCVEQSNALAKLQGQLREDTERLNRDLDGRYDRLNAGTCQLQRSLYGLRYEFAHCTRLQPSSNRPRTMKPFGWPPSA